MINTGFLLIGEPVFVWLAHLRALWSSFIRECRHNIPAMSTHRPYAWIFPNSVIHYVAGCAILESCNIDRFCLMAKVDKPASCSRNLESWSGKISPFILRLHQLYRRAWTAFVDVKIASYGFASHPLTPFSWKLPYQRKAISNFAR